MAAVVEGTSEIEYDTQLPVRIDGGVHLCPLNTAVNLTVSKSVHMLGKPSHTIRSTRVIGCAVGNMPQHKH